MRYQYAGAGPYEDFAGGRVIRHKPGFVNFPVRLACEIFARCLAGLPPRNAASAVRVYDPCCGGGYLLTVLGFMYNSQISALYGSDISQEAADLAEANLDLLSREGLARRKARLTALYEAYGKDSHRRAAASADRLTEMIRRPLFRAVFRRDILEPGGAWAAGTGFLAADIVVTDVPYGRMVSWSGDAARAVDTLLDNLLPNLRENAVAAVSRDRSQKITHPAYERIDSFRSGKRTTDILRRRTYTANG